MARSVGPPSYSGAPLGCTDYLDAFLRQVETSPEAIAVEVHGTDRRTTFAQLLALAEGYRALLERKGARPGDRVALCLPAGPEFLAAWLAASSLEVVTVFLPPSLRPYEARSMLAEARPVGLIGGGDLDLALFRPGLSFVLAAPPGEADARRPLVRAGTSDNPLVSCQFTYKGLGYPLGVVHRFQDYGYAVAAFGHRFSGTAGQTYLAALPMYPIYGLTMSLTFLTLGCRTLVVPHPAKVDLSRLLVDERVRVTALVPLLVRKLVAAGQAQGRSAPPAFHPDLDVVCGGSLLPPSLATRAAEVLGAEFIQGYGLTETMPATIGFSGFTGPDTLGLPLHPEARIEVVDAADNPVAPGRTGQIVVSGPMVSEGYLGRPEATAQFLRGGRWFTGDLGHFDAQGVLHFDGRSLPITKCSAQMVDLTEVEAIAEKHPAVAYARATVSLDPQWDETLCLSVIVRPGQQLTEDDLRRFCGRELSRHKLPRRVRLYRRPSHSVALEASAP